MVQEQSTTTPTTLDSWLGIKRTATPTSEPCCAAAPPTADLGGYRAIERADGRGNVADSAGSFTTRNTKELAKAHIMDLIANPNLRKPQSTSSSQPSRASSRHQAKAPTKPKHPGGRPVGSKRKEPDAVHEEEAVKDFLDANPAANRTKLGVLANDCATAMAALRVEHQELQRKYKQARVLLAAELGCDPGPLRRSQIAELVGTGYDDLKGKTIYRHMQHVLASIRLYAGDDVIKQRQLAESVQATLKPGGQTATEEEDMRHELEDLATDSIREVLCVSDSREGRGRKAGRLKHQDKISRRVIHASIVNQVPNGKVAAVARMLNANREQLREAKKMYDGVKAGELGALYSESAKSCNEYKPEYGACVVKMWNAGTRKSEQKKHEISNTKDKSDKQMYRIHFLEQTIPSLCQWMNIEGKHLLKDPEFHVSIKKVLELKPFYIRKAGRNTSMCR